MKVAVVEAPKQLVIKDLEEPILTEDTVLVKIHTASICNGTDLHILLGIHPGSTSIPCTLGHEGAGTVLTVGEKVKEFKIGDRVAIREWDNPCFAEKVLSSPENLLLIPDSLSFEQASLLEMLTAAYAAVSQAVRVGDKVVIIGQGAAGLMMTQIAKSAGVQFLMVSEPIAFKRKMALEFGADVAIDPLADNLVEAVNKYIGKTGADVVIEASGVGEVVPELPQLIKNRGTIAQFGVFCDYASFRFDWLHFKNGRVLSTGYSGGYSKESHRHALELVLKGQVNLEPLITHHFKLSQLNDAFKKLAENDNPIIKAIIYP